MRASTLWTDQGVDTGPLLMVSDPVEVNLPGPIDSLKKDKDLLNRVVDEHQEKLKEKGRLGYLSADNRDDSRRRKVCI